MCVRVVHILHGALPGHMVSSCALWRVVLWTLLAAAAGGELQGGCRSSGEAVDRSCHGEDGLDGPDFFDEETEGLRVQLLQTKLSRDRVKIPRGAAESAAVAAASELSSTSGAGFAAGSGEGAANNASSPLKTTSAGGDSELDALAAAVANEAIAAEAAAPPTAVAAAVAGSKQSSEIANATKSEGMLAAELDVLQTTLEEETVKLNQVAGMAAQAGVLEGSAMAAQAAAEAALDVGGGEGGAGALTDQGVAGSYLAALRLMTLGVVGICLSIVAHKMQKSREERAKAEKEILDAKQLLQIDQILAFRRQPWAEKAFFPGPELFRAPEPSRPPKASSGDQSRMQSDESGTAFVLPLGSIEDGASGRTAVHVDVAMQPALWPLRATLMRSAPEGLWDRIELTHDVAASGGSSGRPVLICRRSLPVACAQAMPHGGAGQARRGSCACCACCAASSTCSVTDGEGLLLGTLTLPTAAAAASSTSAGPVLTKVNGGPAWQITKSATAAALTYVVRRLEKAGPDESTSPVGISGHQGQGQGQGELGGSLAVASMARSDAADAGDGLLKLTTALSVDSPDALLLLLVVSSASLFEVPEPV
eukprot:TRINITY_DN41270_c0_g1_i2.p1 TRINITY_DN41270_c0_g1~~TRINITY_DN41270_c0_g1_i2.p1  ORF type:complete len:594 (+),score=168.23 TRINITY_DN41270_c0_g1_i2:37-1818(+)